MLALPLAGSTPELYHGKYVAGMYGSGEQGVWYEPSLSNGTLFQDAAGTTPVTAVEQAVGLMLDKRKGLVLGPELVMTTNLASAWTSFSSTPVVSEDEQIKISYGGSALGAYSYLTKSRLSTNLTIGNNYKITGKARVNAGSTVTIAVYSGGATGGASLPITSSVLVPFSAIITPQSDDIYLYISGMGVSETIWLSEISVKEIPGNYAKQPTSADRPVFSARYNLLTKTEQFNDAAWAKDTGVTVTPNQETAPNGQNTADLISLAAGAKALYVNHPTGWAAKSQTIHSFYIKAGPGFSGSTIMYTVVDNNVSDHVITLTDSWQYIRLTFTATGNAFYHEWNNKHDQQPVQFYLWGASVVPANQAHLPYQRVNTATDYDADPVKFPPYLKFNGTNSWMVTNSIDFTGTDKMTVVAGVRKLSDATSAMLVELSANSNLNNGSFYVTAPDSSSANRYTSIARANASPDYLQAALSSSGIGAAPDLAVLTVQHDLPGDLSTLRRNGVMGTNGTANKGTGNFGNYSFYIGSRAGTSLPFNGQIYSLIIRGAATDDAHLTHSEKLVAYKTGVSL